MVRKDGYSIVKIIYHALNRGRSARLSAASNWNFWTTIFICLFVTPALMFYPDFFKWVGMDFSLNHLDMSLRWVGLVVLMITFMGFTLSLHDHEYVLMGTMIHRPVELLILGVIFLMGELHWQFFLFSVYGRSLTRRRLLSALEKTNPNRDSRRLLEELAHPKKRRSKLGLWLEKLRLVHSLVRFGGLNPASLVVGDGEYLLFTFDCWLHSRGGLGVYDSWLVLLHERQA